MLGLAGVVEVFVVFVAFVAFVAGVVVAGGVVATGIVAVAAVQPLLDGVAFAKAVVAWVTVSLAFAAERKEQ